MPLNDDERAQLEAAKLANTAQLLFKCARLVNERAVARMPQAAGAPKVRVAHTALFPHLDFDGLRLTQLAAKVGTTKQAVAQLVNELEQMGIVERVPDPTDGRAKLIRWTRAGGLAIHDGLRLLAEEVAELRKAVGDEHMDRLHEALVAMHAVLTR